MKWQSAFVSAVLIATPASAIFTDDAFHIDYHHALLGLPQSHTTSFHKPQVASNASLLYTLSDKNVLGAVNPRDGSSRWRQFLTGSPATKSQGKSYLVGGQDGTVISGLDTAVVAWDAQDGRLAWDYNLPTGYNVKGLQGVPGVEAGQNGLTQDVILLSGPEKDSSGATVSRIGGDSKDSKWDYKDSSISYDAFISIATSPKHVFFISQSSGILSGGKTKVVVVDIATGAEISQYSVSLDSVPLGEAGSFVRGSGTASPFLVSTEKPFKSIKLNVLGNQKVSTINLEERGADSIQELTVHVASGVSVEPHFLVHARSKTPDWAEVYHIDTKTGAAKREYSITPGQVTAVFAATSVGSTTYFASIADTHISLYTSRSSKEVGSWKRGVVSETSANPVHAALEVSERGKNGAAIRTSILTDDGQWTLIRNGERQWSRPELLAYITKATWADAIDSATLAHEIQAEAVPNPLTAYVLRLTRHAQDLAYLPLYLSKFPEAIVTGSDDAVSVRQKLIGGKLALVATSNQELLALNAAHAGTVIWRVDLTHQMQLGAFVVHLSTDNERLTAYISDGSFAVVDVPTGKLLEFKKCSQSFEKIVELPGSPASTIVRVDSDGVPHVFSELAPSTPSEGNTLLTINGKGEAVGWTIGSSVEKTWTIEPPKDSKFVDVIARPEHDPVASIGKVLGDRSVLYKYITPNVAVLKALSSTTLTLYLINAVTGAVLHSASHASILSDFAVPVVVSENWFAYSFTVRDPVTSGLSTQMIVSELYESEISNDRGLLSARTNYSSFAPDAGVKPHIISQAYTIAAPITDLTVTQTIQGITSRQIIGIAPDLDAIIGIPRDILNARRPVGRDPTPLEAEEGLFKYSPLLDLDPRGFLSHSRELLGLRKVMAAPSLLESTSIVFAYGHDIFGTQLAPSTTFDILGKGFKRFQLILTIVALYSGVLFLRPLVRKKMVERQYKI